MKQRYLVAVMATLALLIVAGGLWLFLGGGPGGQQLQTPQGLYAVPGDTVVTLRWPAITGADGYFVFRDGDPTPVDARPITSTAYEDIGLTNGRTYTYTVTVAPAGSSAALSNSSNQVIVVPTSK